MPNDYFAFKQFRINQALCAQKVSTDACLFGAWVAAHTSPKTAVLDIGAGTGLLMLMIAQQHAIAADGIEIDPQCYGQLKENLQSSPFAARVRAISGDVRTYPFDRSYDLIMSNPPFFDNQLMAQNVQRNLARHSSELSLPELFAVAKRRMQPDGYFAVLLPFNRKEEAESLARQQGWVLHKAAAVRHTPEHPFQRVMLLLGSGTGLSTMESLDIKNTEGSYSDAFRSILSPYYLFL